MCAARGREAGQPGVRMGRTLPCPRRAGAAPRPRWDCRAAAGPPGATGRWRRPRRRLHSEARRHDAHRHGALCCHATKPCACVCCQCRRACVCAPPGEQARYLADRRLPPWRRRLAGGRLHAGVLVAVRARPLPKRTARSKACEVLGAAQRQGWRLAACLLQRRATRAPPPSCSRQLLLATRRGVFGAKTSSRTLESSCSAGPQVQDGVQRGAAAGGGA